MKVITLIYIENDKILLVEKRGVYIPPGGKPKGNETDAQCLEREVKEELNVGVSLEKNFYKRFMGISHDTGEKVEVYAYFGYTIGNLALNPKDSVTGFIFTSKPEDYKLSGATKEMINSLKRDRYLR